MNKCKKNIRFSFYKCFPNCFHLSEVLECLFLFIYFCPRNILFYVFFKTLTLDYRSMVYHTSHTILIIYFLCGICYYTTNCFSCSIACFPQSRTNHFAENALFSVKFFISSRFPIPLLSLIYTWFLIVLCLF